MFNAHKHAESRGLQYSGTISVVGDFDTTYKHNLLAPAHVNVSLYCFPNSKATFQVDKDTLHLDYFEMDKLKKTQVFTILSLLIFLEFNFYKNHNFNQNQCTTFTQLSGTNYTEFVDLQKRNLFQLLIFWVLGSLHLLLLYILKFLISILIQSLKDMLISLLIQEQFHLLLISMLLRKKLIIFSPEFKNKSNMQEINVNLQVKVFYKITF